MNVIINPHQFSGVVRIPASKSHTIRQLLIASLANGVSEINYPLDSLDARSCVSVCRAFGAEVTEYRAVDPAEENPNPAGGKGEKLVKWEVKGNSGFKQKGVTSNIMIDVGNSGTTLYLALAAAGLQAESVEFTGDEQIQRRSAAPLLEALSGLGVQCVSNNGCAPVTVKGPWKGGRVSLPCPTSQYLSALLLASPLAPSGIVTEIDVPLLNERPYVEMTLSYLTAHGIPFKVCFSEDNKESSSYFTVSGGYSWKAFSGSVPGDFSSAAFPAAAAVISGGQVIILGLDPEDTQGDKYFFDILSQMGCDVKWEEKNEEGKAEYALTVSRKSTLRGGTFDLNKTPDLLPAAAVVAAFAHGDTALVNVAHARIKETDRIAVMAEELAKLGVNCTERPDGLIIHGKGAPLLTPHSSLLTINGHGDHRIVMAFAAAALGSPCPIEITGAESAAVTYPGFLSLIKKP
uniref:3-phosphoshikimate 1-carboxyvinyltransferase n=1 Tax=uncultured bacterium contig00087 TaxID=1181560 RepID=A0A806KL34_9BACT|nr:5-enolpyruvylshikimate-3-phosphate synthase [uncultured bacterium contig00087]